MRVYPIDLQSDNQPVSESILAPVPGPWFVAAAIMEDDERITQAVSQCCDTLQIITSVSRMSTFLEGISIIMSHSLPWRHIVLLTDGVYSNNHRVLYTIGISMTRRFQKSVGPSVCL